MEKNPIAQNIKRLREARHWSQEELAAASGVNVRTIQRAESGRPMATESLRALAAAFDTTLEALSVSGDEMLRARKDFEKRFDLIELRFVGSGSDMAEFLGLDAYYLHKQGAWDEAQANTVAEFEQNLKDYSDLWGELKPIQRRAAERDFQMLFERLLKLRVSVSMGSKTRNLRLLGGGPTMRFSFLYVAAVPGETPLRVLDRKRAYLFIYLSVLRGRC